MDAVQVPVAGGLFTWPTAEPQLIASRRLRDGVLSFPAEVQTDGKPGETEEVLLSPIGSLFTWTSQQFRPPSPPYSGADTPDSFQPYAVGYVEFPEGILVEGRLTESDPAKLSIGQPMQLVVIPFRTAPGAEGEADTEVVTFAFSPLAVAPDLGGAIS